MVDNEREKEPFTSPSPHSTALISTYGHTKVQSLG
jgi:hypothetical protein